jgi:hypothetical protein
MRCRNLFTVAALAALVPISTACSGGSSGGAPGTPSSPGPTSGGLTSGSSASGQPADAATRRAIQRAYTALFGTQATFAQSVAALQHGDRFKQAILSESKDPHAQHSGARVTAVSLLRPDVAQVHFTVTDNGEPIFPTVGNAVRVGGRWQVAAKTFCGLLQLTGAAPSACRDPSVTALPH